MALRATRDRDPRPRRSRPPAGFGQGLAARLGLCAAAASATLATALTLAAFSGLTSTAFSHWLFAIDLAIVLASGAVTWVLAVWRLRPLLALVEGAQRLAAGNTGVRVELAGTVGELRELAEAFNRMAARLDDTHRELDRRHRELRRANEELEQLSVTDGLTQLYNHRHFQAQFAREAKRAARTGAPLCLLLVDVDDFKLLNDRLGHSAGDRVLEEIARSMRGQIRETDYLARYGGEEFALLLPQTTLAGGRALAEKIRGAVEVLEAPVIGPEGRAQATVSIGLALFARGPEATFVAADRALYEAKAKGKNQVCIARGEPLSAQ